MVLTESAPLNKTPDAASQRSALSETLDAQYNVTPFTHVDAPKEDIEYVDLEAIDFGKFVEGDAPEAVASRRALARQLDHSLRTYGFFHIVNHGISEETLERINAITKGLHSISEEEKLAHRSGGLTSDEDTNSTGAERGAGFKPRKYWGMANGLRDNIEFYNFLHVVHNDVIRSAKHPEVAQVYLNEISNYFQFIHFSVLRRLSTLCDIILELPEGTFYDRYFKVTQNDIENSGGGFGRLMVYYGLPEGEGRKDDTWLRGHSDSTGFTFIASQPMVSLQIRDYDTKQWRYVKHVPGALVVNIGDAVEFLTGGYWRSTIHRVVNPPPSQQGNLRQSVIYFCKPAWSSIIDPEALDSPRLQKLGISSPSGWERINYGQWDVEKGRLFGKSKVNNLSGDAPAPVYIYGRLAERWVPQIASASF